MLKPQEIQTANRTPTAERQMSYEFMTNLSLHKKLLNNVSFILT